MANILMLLQEHYPKDTRVRKEIFALKDKGHQVDIICLKDDNESDFEELDTVRIFRINLEKKRATRLRYIFEYFSFHFLTWMKVRQLVRTRKYDVVHVHTIPDFLVFAAGPARRRGAKVIIDMHEIWPEFFMSKYSLGRGHIITRVLLFIERRSLQYADYVITINKQLRQKFEGRAKLRHKITEIMNTVSDDVMPRVERDVNDKFIAVYHGTITAFYNLDFVVRALPGVIDKLPGFEFHIYGMGPELDSLRKLVVDQKLEGRVFVHGRVPFDQIPGILAKVSLGILPIRKDVMSDLSFSNKLAEYVHYEIPVLSSDLAGVMDYFPGDSVFYYPAENTAVFQEKLLFIFNNAEQRKAHASRAHALNKSISWDVMKVRIQNLYDEVLSSRS